MVSMGIRFDFRNPASRGTTMAERLGPRSRCGNGPRSQGFDSITLSEHHGCEDGYLPSIFALARRPIAARRKRRAHPTRGSHRTAARPDPCRRGRAVVDHLSNGRLDIVLVDGTYRASSRGSANRCPIASSSPPKPLPRCARRGPANRSSSGRTVRVTPRPFQQPGPPIWLGGSSDGAAHTRRASPTRSCRRCRNTGTPTATRCAPSASPTPAR